MNTELKPRKILKDLALRVGGAVLAVGFIFVLAYLGKNDVLGLGDLLGSSGGLLIVTIVVMEVFFFTMIAVAYVYR